MKINSVFSLSLWVLAAGLGGAWIGTRLGGENDVGSGFVPDTEALWSLPSPQEPVAAQTYLEQLRARKPWGPDSEAAPKQQQPEIVPVILPAWQLVGILQEGKTRFILYIDQEEKTQRATIGETLPDQALIMEIGQDFVVLQREDTMDTAWLHDRPQPPEEVEQSKSDES